MANYLQRFDSYTVAAGETVRLSVPGAYLTILNFSGYLTYLSFDDGPRSLAKRGLEMKAPEGEWFSSLLFNNESGSASTFDLCISDGEVTDRSNSITNTVTVKGGSTPTTPAAVSVGTGAATSLFATDATVTQSVIQNNGSYDLWVGDSAIVAGSSRGIKIIPGGSITVPGGGQLYGQSTGGTTTASIMRITE